MLQILLLYWSSGNFWRLVLSKWDTYIKKKKKMIVDGAEDWTVVSNICWKYITVKAGQSEGQAENFS